MLIKRNQIIYIPYFLKEDNVNEYIINMIEILQSKYKVTGLLELSNLIKILKTKAIFLNWIEEKLDRKMKFRLWLYHILGTKVIWVFHNRFPHDVSQNNKIIENMKWISDNSDFILLHSKNSWKYIPNIKKNLQKAVYIPHVMYKRHLESVNYDDIRIKYKISKTDFVFTIFGSIRPYKNIEGGIEAFLKLELENTKLIIAGEPENIQYAKQIRKRCIGNQNIILDFQYVSNIVLEGIIGVSDVIVLPYHDGSSMNSGVMIQAFSYGKTVISPDICMARDFMKEKFFYGYRYSLANAMRQAYENGKEVNEKMGKQAQAYIRKEYNEKIVSEKLFYLLEVSDNKQRKI